MKRYGALNLSSLALGMLVSVVPSGFPISRLPKSYGAPTGEIYPRCNTRERARRRRQMYHGKIQASELMEKMT